MRSSTSIGASALIVVLGLIAVRPVRQNPTIEPVTEKALREYTGVYGWDPDTFVYLQLWNEFSGFDKPGQLVAFDESGEVRVLHPSGRDRFFAGPGAAVATAIESRIEFQRDGSNRIISLTWTREGAASRTARRIEIEKHEVRAVQVRNPGHPGMEGKSVLVHHVEKGL